MKEELGFFYDTIPGRISLNDLPSNFHAALKAVLTSPALDRLKRISVLPRPPPAIVPPNSIPSASRIAIIASPEVENATPESGEGFVRPPTALSVALKVVCKLSGLALPNAVHEALKRGCETGGLLHARWGDEGLGRPQLALMLQPFTR